MKKISIKNTKPKQPGKFWRAVPTVILTFAVYILSQFVAGLVVIIVPLVLGWDSARTNTWLDTVGVNFGLIILVEVSVILMIHRLLKVKKLSFDDIGLNWPRPKDLLYALGGFGVYFGLYLVVAALIKVLVPGVDFNQQQQLGFDTLQQGFSLVLIFLALVVAAPITEEILTRGFLYKGLKTELPKWGAAVVTSLIFAAAHLQIGQGQSLVWVAAIDTFVLSIVLIYLREKTGYLGAPILLHMIKNLLAFLLLFVLRF